LIQAKAGLDGLYTALNKVVNIPLDTSAAPGDAFMQAMDDDLNTPMAIAQLHDLARRINKSEDAAELKVLKSEILASGELLGILQQQPEAWFRWQAVASDGLSDEAIDALIEERMQAKQHKDFQRADEIRNQLQEAGILLEDGAGETTWKRG